MSDARRKPLIWIGSSRKDCSEFPSDVHDVMGRALLDAQFGDLPRNAKPLRGFGGASVLEITDRYDGDTYRTVYTVRFSEAIYVLHAFQKKSKRGIETPKRDIEQVRARLRMAQEVHRRRGGGR